MWYILIAIATLALGIGWLSSLKEKPDFESLLIVICASALWPLTFFGAAIAAALGICWLILNALHSVIHHQK